MSDQSKKKSYVGVIIAVVILLILAAVAVVWYTNRKFLNKTPVPTTTDPAPVSGSVSPGGNRPGSTSSSAQESAASAVSGRG
ncbi:MAG TPA: hypothetical protein VEB40_00980 [Flavipsychrobacter sp.]|nr:hypothetical protein [Flavipsychrobacter sp.]